MEILYYGVYNRDNRPEHLEFEPEDEVYEDDKGPYILQSGGKAIKGMRDKKATGDDVVPGDVLKFLGEDGLTSDTVEPQQITWVSL